MGIYKTNERAMRTILISGASRGIGNAIAKKAIQDGHRISLGIRNTDSIKDTILDPSVSGKEKILIQNYEALKESSAKEWVNKTINYFGSIDTVINCAGIFKRTEFLFQENEIKDIDEIYRVNILGPWLLTKACWEHLINSKNGRVQILVSMSGKRSKGKLASYTMSKFGLMGLSQTIRNEGWDHGIRVTTICPGWVNTDMAKEVKGIQKENMTQPEEIATISSTLLNLPNNSIPFEIALNCTLEK